jgi:hypothetical protein
LRLSFACASAKRTVHPLRAIAKVAAIVIVVGAFALKAARWGWSVV